MSASIYWLPLRGERFDIGAPRAFLQRLRAAFRDSHPMLLNEGSLPALHRLRAEDESDDQQAAIQTLIDAIHRDGEVILWAEY